LYFLGAEETAAGKPFFLIPWGLHRITPTIRSFPLKVSAGCTRSENSLPPLYLFFLPPFRSPEVFVLEDFCFVALSGLMPSSPLELVSILSSSAQSRIEGEFRRRGRVDTLPRFFFPQHDSFALPEFFLTLIFFNRVESCRFWCIRIYHGLRLRKRFIVSP